MVNYVSLDLSSFKSYSGLCECTHLYNLRSVGLFGNDMLVYLQSFETCHLVDTYPNGVVIYRWEYGTFRTFPSMDMSFVMSRTCPGHFIYSIPIYIYVINNCNIASISASSDSILMIYDSLDLSR